MAETEKQAAAAGETNTEATFSLLESAISATKQTERSRAEELLRTFTEQALQGAVTFDKDLTRSVKATIDSFDKQISKQLAAIMHHPDFQKLEGSWRGLSHLVMNSETGTQLKIRVLNCSKKDLQKDLEKAVEFDQSELFKKIYESEFGSPGGIPYGSLVGDYEFQNHPDDITMLKNIAGVAAAAFCPFISAASPNLFGMEDWQGLTKPRDLAKIFDTVEHTSWRSFRESEDARFVTLTMPRTLARLPYGANTKPIDEFNFEEVELGAGGSPKSVGHHEYCWMNTAYVLGTRMTDTFAQTGWCTAIRGAEGGGKVEGLPAHVFTADDGDVDLKCPTEVAITDRREKELSDLGFLPLCHYKEKDYAVFFGAQTCQKPKEYQGKDGPAATANAAISARLPYIMATSRIAHYLKCIAATKSDRSKAKTWKNG
ncbi:MAG: type VI secretion system contractile sheath large subunit [Pirellulaceae bacterium]